jgi:dihydrofolate synthase/folylpolyglutamate synthase
MPKLSFESYYSERGEFNNLEFTLNRIEKAAEEAGISDNIAKQTVHIAGTNGKGSTASFIDQILSHRGQTTACFTSPHIKSVTERIKLNGEKISDVEFNNIFEIVRHLIDKYSLSYFEGLTLVAFKYFSINMPDVAIIETGLGGRLDATNILKKKIPVITSISKDHVEYLGDDILNITDEKIAIVQNNLLVFVGDNTEYLNKYLDYKLHSKTIIRATYSDEPYMGFGQPFANNLRLAESVCDLIVTGDMPDKLTLPQCRDERIGRFILDGAHNEDALNKLAERYKDVKPIVIFSSTSDRNTKELMGIVESFAQKVILTTIPFSERSINLNNISTNNIKEESPDKAVKIAVELNENADILVCGSLYLCAHIREILSKGIL